MDAHSKIEEKIIKDLNRSDWQIEDTLIHQNIPTNGKLAEFDIVLLYNLFPVAIVEVKSPRYNLHETTFQVLNYAEMADVPFGLLSDGENIIKINRHGKADQIERFSFPQDLLEEAGYSLNQNDPLFYPAAKMENLKVRFHQVKAISKAFESLKQRKDIAIILPVGTGVNYVATQIILKTINSSFYNRVLVVCDRIVIAEQISKMLNDFGIGSISSTNNVDEPILPETKVMVTNYHKITKSNPLIERKNKFDFIVFWGHFNNDLWNSISNYLPDSATLTISNTKTAFGFSKQVDIAYQYS